MINLVDIPKPEVQEEPTSPYAEVEQKLESSLRNLMDQIRSEQANEFTQKLYAAMNIWYTVATIHPDENKKNTYMLMSKSIALLIDKSLLSDEQLERYSVAVTYEPKEGDEENKSEDGANTESEDNSDNSPENDGADNVDNTQNSESTDDSDDNNGAETSDDSDNNENSDNNDGSDDTENSDNNENSDNANENEISDNTESTNNNEIADNT